MRGDAFSGAHPLSQRDAHPLTELRRVRAEVGEVTRTRLRHGAYILTFADGSEESWEFDRRAGTFELTELTCPDALGACSKVWQDEW